MSSTDEVSADICANCGKGEESTSSLKACTACHMVKYCNRECQIAHRPQHKKECKKRAAELYDELLLKRPPPEYEDCTICFLRMPSVTSGRTYQTCCGKMLCSGCIHAPVYDDQGNEVDNEICPFCRTPETRSNKEHVERMNKRMEAGDPIAICHIGYYYYEGSNGFPQDCTKALELWHRAGERGSATSYFNIGSVYYNGVGVTVDKKKGVHYMELAAMMGCASARYKLGAEEENKGNMDRAIKHYMIAVESGHSNSLTVIRELYADKYATKEDYANALRARQTHLNDIKSEQRDNAAAGRANCKYIDC